MLIILKFWRYHRACKQIDYTSGLYFAGLLLKYVENPNRLQ